MITQIQENATERKKRLGREARKRYYLKTREKQLEAIRKWRAMNPDLVKKQKKRYFAKNKIKVYASINKWKAADLEKWKKRSSEYTKRYRENNPDKNRARCAKYRQDNKESVSATIRAWNKANAERARASRRKNRKENPVKVAEENARSRMRRKNQLHGEADRHAIHLFYVESRTRTDSTEIPNTVDHIIPLATGGFHHQDNLQVITQSMNSSKNADPFWLAPHMGIKDWRDVPRYLWPIDLVPKYLALIEKHKGETIRWDAAA